MVQSILLQLATSTSTSSSGPGWSEPIDNRQGGWGDAVPTGHLAHHPFQHVGREESELPTALCRSSVELTLLRQATARRPSDPDQRPSERPNPLDSVTRHDEVTLFKSIEAQTAAANAALQKGTSIARNIGRSKSHRAGLRRSQISSPAGLVYSTRRVETDEPVSPYSRDSLPGGVERSTSLREERAQRLQTLKATSLRRLFRRNERALQTVSKIAEPVPPAPPSMPLFSAEVPKAVTTAPLNAARGSRGAPSHNGLRPRSGSLPGPGRIDTLLQELERDVARPSSAERTSSASRRSLMEGVDTTNDSSKIPNEQPDRLHVFASAPDEDTARSQRSSTWSSLLDGYASDDPGDSAGRGREPDPSPSVQDIPPGHE